MRPISCGLPLLMGMTELENCASGLQLIVISWPSFSSIPVVSSLQCNATPCPIKRQAV